MKVLWFTPSPSLYKSGTNIYNGGGWISSAEYEIRKYDNIELAVAFILDGEPRKVEQDGVVYYPMPKLSEGGLFRLWHTFFHVLQSERHQWPVWARRLNDVVDDFHPDVIHVFGSEGIFGLVAMVTDIPVVLHVQGLMWPYKNAFLPPGVSRRAFLFQDWQPLEIMKRMRNITAFRQAIIREREIFRLVNHFIGRTTWDRRYMEVIHPNAKYHYGGEILRDVFYQEGIRYIPEQLTIVSTISSPMYKGFDLILKTAKILREWIGIDIEWRVFGNINPRIAERLTGIRHEKVGVRLCGVASAGRLRDELLHCTAYAHTSYIDNSPNSVCEAQILGVPVVVTHVGGTPSLIKEGVTGYTVPANDPWQMAAVLVQLHKNREQNMEIGGNARIVALERHDKKKIVGQILKVYNELIDGK